MKFSLTVLLVAMALPFFSSAQSFHVPKLSLENDVQFFARELEKRSPLLQKLYAVSALKTDMKPEEAKALIESKLAELNNDDLNKTYEDMSPQQMARIGIILYLLMNGLSNTEDFPGLDYKSKFGGGVGVFLMYTLAQFVLMPELNFMWRSYGQEYGGGKYSETYTYLTLAFTALYIIRAQTINFVLGLSPNIGYALSGRYKDDDEKGDIDFDDWDANRINFGIGITAGIMLQNAMMIRLIYNFGLSKLYENSDPRMYYFALAVSIPLWNLK